MIEGPVVELSEDHILATYRLRFHSDYVGYFVETTSPPRIEEHKKFLLSQIQRDKLFIHWSDVGSHWVITGVCWLYNCQGSSGEIGRLAVDKEYRRRGIGNRLMAHVIRYAVAQSYKSLDLLVKSSNTKAIGLYQKLGFSSTEDCNPSGLVKMSLDLLIC